MLVRPTALRAVSVARRHVSPITLAASVATFSILAMTPSQAMQSCSAAPASDTYWSWRIIDGRKCWYKGKPGLSKSLLEWPAHREASADVRRELATASAAEKHRDLMDAQARAADDTDTFESLWRSRIQKP